MENGSLAIELLRKQLSECGEILSQMPLERAEGLDVTQAPIKAVMSGLTVHWAE